MTYDQVLHELLGNAQLVPAGTIMPDSAAFASGINLSVAEWQTILKKYGFQCVGSMWLHALGVDFDKMAGDVVDVHQSRHG